MVNGLGGYARVGYGGLKENLFVEDWLDVVEGGGGRMRPRPIIFVGLVGMTN